MRNTNDRHAMADPALTEILMRLIPKPGERRIVRLTEGQLDVWMEALPAAAWMEMLERLEVLAAQYGREQTVEIFDASALMANAHSGTAQ